MPDRHRHEEFIWALIFSLIINLLFVFAFLAPRYGRNSQSFQPLVVSIAASHRALPSQSSAIPAPITIAAPTKSKKTINPPPSFQPQKSSVDPPLPTGDTEVKTISPIAATELTGAETVLRPFATAGGGGTAPIANETADGLSIFGDKMKGDNYTAPEYLGGEKPPYPKRAERNGWEGTVLLSLWINTAGAVENVEIAKTSGYEVLDQQARASVGAWRFNPARRNGIAIAVTVLQPIIFRPLPENAP